MAARRAERVLPLALAATVAGAMLLANLATSGIWDPYELDAADLARRIAVRVLGASHLELPTEPPAVLPTLGDLRMGELPFTSMAAGFRVFGLRDWSGRLPLALWAFAGAMALYAFLARLVARRAGLYAVIALCTMPLYFMQARTMLGDAVTMAAATLALCGLGGASLDRGLGVRLAWGLVGVAGLVAGFLCRGLLVGVAAPLLSVGLAWLVLVAAEPAAAWAAVRADLARNVVGAAAVLGGLGVAVWTVNELWHTTPSDPVRRVLGVALLRKVPVEATFDLYVRQLGHALFPWSALLPFAIGRLFRAPPESDAASPSESASVSPSPSASPSTLGGDREMAVRVLMLVAAGVFFAVYSFLAPYAGVLPFAAPAALAAIAALAIFDLERGAPASRTVALAAALLAFVLYRDMATEPLRSLAAFAVDKPTFPKSFEAPAVLSMKAVGVAFAVLVALGWFERQPRDLPPARAWLAARLDAYLDALRELSRTWNGNLVFSFVVAEAALVGLGAMLFLGQRFDWAAVQRLPKNFASVGLNAWWLVPFVAVMAVPALVLVRDGWRAVLGAARLPRSVTTVLAGVFAGAFLAFWYYPALAAQLSPKEVFESFARLGKPGEPLGLVGVRGRTAAYYSAERAETFADPQRAFDWLMHEGAGRRWLVVKAEELPKLNALYRRERRVNLPVLDGRSSQILLVSNDLGGAENQSWISEIVPDAPVMPQRRVDAQFEDQLEVLGWEVRDEDGALVSDVVPQTRYRMRFYYRVLAPITGAWKAFLHIDGHQRRFNGDHAVLDGKYPMNLWQVGDVVIDELEVQLEPNFTPGDYAIYFGFFVGETRYRVSRGANHDNRVQGGALRVR
jgi:hypothetical protein